MAGVRDFAPPIVGVKGSRAPLSYGGGLVNTQEKPAIIVWIRMTRVGYKGFDRVCRSRGIGTVAVNADGLAVAYCYECIGNVEDLEYLAGHPSVVKWEYIYKTANATDCRASGAGKPK